MGTDPLPPTLHSKSDSFLSCNLGNFWTVREHYSEFPLIIRWGAPALSLTSLNLYGFVPPSTEVHPTISERGFPPPHGVARKISWNLSPILDCTCRERWPTCHEINISWKSSSFSKYNFIINFIIIVFVVVTAVVTRRLPHRHPPAIVVVFVNVVVHHHRHSHRHNLLVQNWENCKFY